MEYINMGTVVVGILLIVGFFNADALFREPSITNPEFLDSMDDTPSNPGENSILLQPGVMMSKEILDSLSRDAGIPAAELERRIMEGDSLQEIAESTGVMDTMNSFMEDHPRASSM